MARKVEPQFRKGHAVVIVGWDSRIPTVVVEDSDKTHTMVASPSPWEKPWKVLNAQLQKVES